MNTATMKLSLILGSLAGIMGIEHGIGEVLEGNRPTEGVFILSWPDTKFFEIMAGEPALTLLPNYLLTGLVAITFACLFLALLAKAARDRRLVPLLFVPLLLMLLAGGGFGPSVLGVIAVLIAFKIDSPLKLWSKLPVTTHRALSRLWPWSLGICLLGWLMLFPGASLVAAFTGMEDELLMFIPILVAFAFIPVTLLLGFSRDVLERNAEAGLAETSIHREGKQK